MSFGQYLRALLVKSTCRNLAGRKSRNQKKRRRRTSQWTPACRAPPTPPTLSQRYLIDTLFLFFVPGFQIDCRTKRYIVYACCFQLDSQIQGYWWYPFDCFSQRWWSWQRFWYQIQRCQWRSCSRKCHQQDLWNHKDHQGIAHCRYTKGKTNAVRSNLLNWTSHNLWFQS